MAILVTTITDRGIDNENRLAKRAKELKLVTPCDTFGLKKCTKMPPTPNPSKAKDITMNT